MNLRNILAIILGLVIAFSTVLLIEEVGHQIYPPSQEILDAQKQLTEVSPKNSEEVKAASDAMKQAMKAYLTHAPTGSMIMVLTAWFLGALFGSFTAAGLSKSRRILLGMSIGIAVWLATLFNLITLPYHPLWMTIISLTLLLPFAYVGARLGIVLFPPKKSNT